MWSAPPIAANVSKNAAWLRSAVLNGARSQLRRRAVRRRHREVAMADAAGADTGALAGEEQTRIMVALRQLPVRQREALVLRYYADLSEAQTAHAMGISPGAVKSHTARGIAALRHLLEEEV